SSRWRSMEVHWSVNACTSMTGLSAARPATPNVVHAVKIQNCKCLRIMICPRSSFVAALHVACMRVRGQGNASRRKSQLDIDRTWLVTGKGHPPPLPARIGQVDNPARRVYSPSRLYRGTLRARCYSCEADTSDASPTLQGYGSSRIEDRNRSTQVCRQLAD